MGEVLDMFFDPGARHAEVCYHANVRICDDIWKHVRHGVNAAESMEDALLYLDSVAIKMFVGREFG